jgi:hypothetical protein
MIPRLRKTLTAAIIIANLALVSPAGAELHDRGGGLIYDDVLDVTWLQDAAWHVTSNAPNVDANGRMLWQDAMNWASSLVYHVSVRNIDWDDWRLTHALPVNRTAYDLTNAPDGTTDNGYNITSPASELSYMYHVNLGNLSLLDTQGNLQPGYGLNNTGPFAGLESSAYWTNNDWPADPNKAFVIGMGNGHQNSFEKDTALSVWAVRDGDVAILPDGDLNNDGLVNTGDLLISVRILQGHITATTEQRLRGEVAPLINGSPAPDGTITLGDVEVLERKIQGLVSFP